MKRDRCPVEDNRTASANEMNGKERRSEGSRAFVLTRYVRVVAVAAAEKSSAANCDSKENWNMARFTILLSKMD